MALSLINMVMHLVLLAAAPPLMLGLIQRTKALLAGRKGPPLLQPYYDLYKLLRKGIVLSKTTTWIFRAGPMVTLVAVLLGGLLVPFGTSAAPLHFQGDVILLIYVLALARFFTSLAALDTGSSFEGMGAAREVTFACLSEAALMLGLLVLIKFSGSLSLNTMLRAPAMHAFAMLPVASLMLAAVGMFIVLLAENARIPVDDPATHLELTMIHEVMVLDHSGPLLALVNYGAAVKLFVFAALFLHFVPPVPMASPALNWVVFAAEMLGVAVAIGLVESLMARLRLTHVPTLLVAASLLCGFGFILMLR